MGDTFVTQAFVVAQNKPVINIDAYNKYISFTKFASFVNEDTRVTCNRLEIEDFQ